MVFARSHSGEEGGGGDKVAVIEIKLALKSMARPLFQCPTSTVRSGLKPIPRASTHHHGS